jgi:chromosome segregation ATPase
MGLTAKVDNITTQTAWIVNFLRTQGLSATELQAQLANMTASRDSLQTQLNQANTDKTNLQNSLTAMTAARDAANNTIAVRDATIVSLNTDKTNLQKALTAMTANCDNKEKLFLEEYEILHRYDDETNDATNNYHVYCDQLGWTLVPDVWARF